MEQNWLYGKIGQIYNEKLIQAPLDRNPGYATDTKYVMESICKYTIIMITSAGLRALAQYRSWYNRWADRSPNSSLPKTHIECLKLCDETELSSISGLLEIAAIMPVSTASVERDFSALKLLKTYLRNSETEQRLNSLALMYMYNDQEVNIDNAIDRFAATRKAY